MRFENIFVESHLKEHPTVTRIQQALRRDDLIYIDRYDDFFGKVRKPYLHKRTNLNLILAEKRGSLVKLAPPAYGTHTGEHYFFFHQYNCIYECDYCYLQGYFPSPDIVVFINHDDICAEITKVAKAAVGEVWFHAGEYSDSLALSGLTQEWESYWQTFKALPNAWLELRTKSANVRTLAACEPLPNVVVSFSLSTPAQAERHDRGAPPIAARLRAMRALAERGFMLGVHCDPLIDSADLESGMQWLAAEVCRFVPQSQLAYISLGVVRFPKAIYSHVRKNYPTSDLHKQEFVQPADGKIRYSFPHRARILRSAKARWEQAGVDPKKVYYCMESEEEAENDAHPSL